MAADAASFKTEIDSMSFESSASRLPWHPVDKHQGIRVIDRADTTHTNRGAVRTGLSRFLNNRHTRRKPLESRTRPHNLSSVDVISFHDGYRTGQVRLFLYAISHDNDLLQTGGLLLHRYIESMSRTDFLNFGHIAEKGKFQFGRTGRDRDRIFS